MGKRRTKAERISEIHGFFISKPRFKALPAVCNALYESAKGTRHLYEALELLAVVMPEEYGPEFEEIKNRYQ